MSLLHNDIRNKGLNEFTAVATAGNLKVAICKTEPTILSQVTALDGAGGKRVTTELTYDAGDVSVADKAGGGREAIFASKVASGAVSTNQGEDLYIAIYDATRLLYVGNEPSDSAINNGADTTIGQAKVQMGNFA